MGSSWLTAFLIVCVIVLSITLGFLLHTIKEQSRSNQSLEAPVTEETESIPVNPPEESAEQPDTSELPEEPEVPEKPETSEETAEPEEPESVDETEEPESTEAQEETEEPPVTVGGAIAEQAAEILAGMTLEEHIYQMFIVTPEQLTGVGQVVSAGETTRQALQSQPVGGLIYFAANISDPAQVTTMIANTQSYSKLGLFISVDEEGGRVERLGGNSAMGTTSFPAMLNIPDTESAYNVGQTIGNDLKRFGFNLDFAPVADVYSNTENTVIGDRAFSSDPLTAAELVSAAVKGFGESGTLCTLKHFPGHGDTAADSHNGAAVSYKTEDELQSCEFLPFRAGITAGADLVMVGHISLPNVTGNQTPATMSHTIVTGLLREKLGFDGVVITDAMNMGAIVNYYSSGEAAVAAVEAGVDLILMPGSLSGAVSGIQSAVASGELTEERINESVMRILMLKLEHGIIQ